MPKQFYYEGFSSPNGTIVPDDVFDVLAPQLTEAELRVLLYIIRRTFGFKKDRDSISLTQLVEGIKTKDGKVLDRGTGMSRRGVMKGCAGLIEKGIITVEKRLSDKGDNEVNIYSLRFKDEGRVGNNVPYGGERSSLGVGNEVAPQQTVLQKTVKQGIYPSNIRKAKSDETDYVNSNGSAEEAAKRYSVRHNEGVAHSQTHSTTQNRNIEKIEAKKHVAPAEKRDVPVPTASAQRTGGLAHIGQTLHSRLPTEPPAVDDDDTVAREAIEQYIRDIAAKLHDEAPLKSSASRAFNLYRQTGADLNIFFNLLYDAEKEANRRSATIKKITSLGFKNRMAYFFAVLEDKLGVRHQSKISFSTR